MLHLKKNQCVISNLVYVIEVAFKIIKNRLHLFYFSASKEYKKCTLFIDEN